MSKPKPSGWAVPRAVASHEPSTRSQVVAVTGTAGFLGAHLVGVLEDSPRVARIVSLDRHAPASAGQKTQHAEVDLTDLDAEQRVAEVLRAEAVDTVVHLAFHDNPTHHPDLSHTLESVGTMRLLNACRASRVTKFVLWSQTALYGASPKNPCFLEESRPLLADAREPYFRDKLQAERDVLEFGLPGRGRVVTILRTAPIIGPHIDNFVARYLGQPAVPTILGFDPLMQFLHEADAVAALKRAISADAHGVFNIAGDGVLPLSKAVHLVGRRRLPLTRSLAHLTIGALWVARRSPFPPAFLDYVQYACVADTDAARRLLGFVPMYSAREALAELGATQNLRDVRLISETPA
jgi:UDP-glucose 4-epimerase